MIAATTWPPVALPSMSRVSKPRTDSLSDLFDGQAIPQGGWVMPDKAGSAFWPGITRSGVAGCGWAAVTVGSQLGSQLGYRLPREPAGVRPPLWRRFVGA